MADKASDVLPYGQFGQAAYDPDIQEWSFSRSVGLTLHLRPVGLPRIIAEASVLPAQSGDRGEANDFLSRRRDKQVRTLVQEYPELQPATDLLPELARVSEAIEDAASQNANCTSQLVALGKIYDESRRNYVDAIAFPAGPTGSDLRITQGLKQRQGWSEDRSSWIETIDFSGESVTWSGPGVPILGITLAQPVEAGEHYLAVRLPTKTLVFRPILEKHAASGSSRLKSNLLFSINLADTGSTTHRYVAFNPWFTGQLAIIDEEGDWTIWETGRRSRTAKKLRSWAAGAEEARKGKRSINDGWACIVWVESTSTLCVATRRKLHVVDLQAADTVDMVEVDVGLGRGVGRILEVTVVQKYLDHLCILTSNHVLVYRIKRTSGQQLSATIVIQVRHHRNPDNLSLRMTLGAGNDGVKVILRCATGSSITQFGLSFKHPNSIQVQQPRSFDLGPSSGLVECHLEHAPFFEDTEGNDDLTRAFFNLYILRKDGSLLQSLYESFGNQCSVPIDPPPLWTTNATKRKKTLKTLLGGFLEDRGGVETSWRPPASKYIHKRQQQDRSRSSDDWTISYERTVKRLNEPPALDLTDMEEVIEEVSARLQEYGSEGISPMRSLWEIADAAVAVSDIEGASSRLEGLHSHPVQNETVKDEDRDTARDGPDTKLTIVHIAASAANDMLGLKGLDTPREAIQTVRNTFSAHQGGSSPESSMYARDLLINRLAAEVTLGSQCLMVQDVRTGEEAVSQSQSRAWDLPVRPTPTEEMSQGEKTADDYARSRSQTPALPAPSASASTITGFSHPSSFAAPEVGQLSKYTTFAKDPPSALPRTLNKVLSHWTIGTDPAEYDWQSTARQVLRRNDEEAGDDEMTEKERRQMQRRTERYIRRQRREAEESQRQQMLSSQAPEVVSASQPAQRQELRRVESQASAGAAIGSSQSHGLSQMVASQVVPGRHGGRPPPKKKRKSGF